MVVYSKRKDRVSGRGFVPEKYVVLRKKPRQK